MNPFTLDFSKYYDDILSSFKTIFGYKYASIIDERLGNVLLTTYSNYEGIKAYYEYLEDVKSRELCIKFLNNIGIDLTSFNIVSYADKIEGDLKDIISVYLDGDYAFKPTFQVIPDTFKAFFTDEDIYSKNTIIYNRIKFINKFTSRNITFETYSEFIKTDEYKELIKLFKKFNEIYIELCAEMNEYLESIKELKEHYTSEMKRHNKIVMLKNDELYEEIKGYFDYDIKDELYERGLDKKLLIEYFSKEYSDKLKNSNTSLKERNLIISYREAYLRKLDNKRVPTSELVEKITKLREEKKEESIRKFILESDTFKKAYENFADTYETKEYLYRMIKNRRVCVHAGTFNGKFIPLMFLTIREYECGTLDYIVLHEMIHALESEPVEYDNYRCGFEPKIFFGEPSPHVHLHPKRKYERLNETITDLFALEALEILHTLDIYFMDEKSRTKLTPGDSNTSIVLKKLLTPFMERYRELIIDARICGNMDNLMNHIGKDNFEELNDIIDYIDMLVEMGLCEKLNERNMEDRLVVEYVNELKKLSNVYADMDDCYKSYVEKKKVK